MKRAVAMLAAWWALNLMPGPALGQAPAAPAPEGNPAVYALIAAVGENFSVVSEVGTVGTHLSPYRRTTETVPNNLLNRLALNSLDAAIAKIDAGSKRVYATFPAVSMEGVAPPERSSVAIAKIISALNRIPQHKEWDRILIALPAYRALAANGMASKLQGFGIFSEPMCQAGCGAFTSTDLRYLDAEPLDGVEATTRENETIKARTYLAPFSYIEVWVVDAKTLTVIDRQQGFDHQKLAEKVFMPALDPNKLDTQQYLTYRIAGLIEHSIGEAVRRSELNSKRPHVEVGDIKEVKPDDVGK